MTDLPVEQTGTLDRSSHVLKKKLGPHPNANVSVMILAKRKVICGALHCSG